MPTPGFPASFLLVHGPLVGPGTWGPVADVLRARGAEVVVPSLAEASAGEPPHAERHVVAVVGDVASAAVGEPVLVVGHSGAGALLPAIGRALGDAGIPVAGYLFIDAGIPEDGKSRLDLFTSKAEAQAFRAAASKGMLPVWSSDDLSGEIPDDTLRAEIVSELRPMPLAVYEEKLRVPEGFPDRPVAYLQFSEFYDESADEAQRRGWFVRTMAGGHFHHIVEPAAVTDLLLELAVVLAFETMTGE